MSSSTDGIPIGRVGRPHGVHGEVTLVPETDETAYLAPGSTLSTDGGAQLRVRASRPYRDRGLIVAFEGVDDRRGAEALRGAVLAVPASARRELEEGEWWPDDLVGLRAVDSSGRVLGEVSGVIIGGVQDRLVVATPDGRDVEVPFVDDLVDDPAGDIIVIRPPAGLFGEG